MMPLLQRQKDLPDSLEFLLSRLLPISTQNPAIATAPMVALASMFLMGKRNTTTGAAWYGLVFAQNAAALL